MPPKTSRTAADDYRAKTSQEITQLTRRANRYDLAPFGDPFSGITLVAEKVTEDNVGTHTDARIVDALRRSLAAVRLDRAYVTWPHPDLLKEILSLEPSALVAVGPGAVRAIDSLGYPLVKRRFAETTEGSWFAWTDGVSGLRLPALAPALDDADAKRRFWRAFLAMRALATGGEWTHP